MFKTLAVAAAAAVCTSGALAATAVGSATLIDTATVHAGTTGPLTYLSYVSGGNGATGWADGSTWGGDGYTPAAAMATADHHWLQYDAPILMFSAAALDSVIAVPAIDHGWTPDNTGEFWEAFEFRVFGCLGASTTACVEEGKITDVYTLGVDNAGSGKNADDWTTRWGFSKSYNYFAVFSGDRLVGGYYSPGEGEIDALAVAIPEPGTYALMSLGLLALGFRRRAAAR